MQAPAASALNAHDLAARVVGAAALHFERQPAVFAVACAETSAAYYVTTRSSCVAVCRCHSTVAAQVE